METRSKTISTTFLVLGLLLCLPGCTASTAHEIHHVPVATSDSSQNGAVVLCYYTPTSFFPASNVPADICTHIVYAFGSLTGGDSPTITAPSPGVVSIWQTLTSLRQQNPQLKVMLSLQNGFPLVVGPNVTRMQQFADNAVAYLRRYQFDGVDMDWEYPQTTQKNDYATFFTIMRKTIDKELKPRGESSLLLSLALPNNYQVTKTRYDIPTISSAVDFGTVMAYDFHVFISKIDNKTGYNSPLYTPSGESQYLSGSAITKYTLSRGFLASKLLLGIPTYGRSWTLESASSHGLHAPAVGKGAPGPYRHISGVYTYPDVCVALKGGAKNVTDPKVVGAYLYQDVNWVAYDDVTTVTTKCQWAASQGLGGVGVWAMHLDDNVGVCDAGQLPLIAAMKNTLVGHP